MDSRPDDDAPTPPRSLLLYAIMLFGAAIALYLYVSNLEVTGGRMNWMAYAVYRVAGKWGVVAIPTAFGIYLCVAALRGLAKQAGSERLS